MSVSVPFDFLEREGDLAELGLVVAAAAAGKGGLGIIAGPAGIGKTALLNAERQRAGEHGGRVLHARGSKLEHTFAFGVVRQLLEAEVIGLSTERRALLFEGAAAPAAAVFGVGMRAESDTVFEVLNALYRVLVGLAGVAPLVLSVDDVHRADEGSLGFLAYAATRLEYVRVAVLLAMRSAEPGARDERLDYLLAVPGARVVRPAPLSRHGVATLVRGSLMPDAGDDLCLACHRESAGNPFYLWEMIRTLRLEGGRPTPAQVERVGSATIAHHVLRRVAAAGKGALDLARAMAVLGDNSYVRHAAQLAGVPNAGELARALLEMEVLANEDPVRFVHPIVRRAIYADLTIDKRERLHLRAARLLIDANADPERAATHLLPVVPATRDWVIVALRSAAKQARDRGAPGTEAVYLRRALLECAADAAQKRRVLRDLGNAENHAADDGAVDHLRQALAASKDLREQAGIRLDLAGALRASGREPEAASEIRLALAEQQAIGDPDLMQCLQAALVALASVDARVVAPDAAALYHGLVAAVPNGPAGTVVLAIAAADATWTGASARTGAKLAERAIGRGLLESDEWDAIGACILTLIYCEHYDAAGKHLKALHAAVQRRGHTRGIALTHQLDAACAERLGCLAQAESSARQALAIIEPRQIAVSSLGWIACSLVDTLIQCGDLDAAEAVLAYMPAAKWPPHQGCASTLAARGRLRLAQERPTEALEDLFDVGRRYRAWPGFRLLGPAPSHWRSSAALALQLLGRPEEARHLAFEEVTHARIFGALRALGVALRGAANVAATREQALELLNESAAVLENSPALLEYAHTLAALGATLRRIPQRKAARTQLNHALELAVLCGAVPLAERILVELRRVGGQQTHVTATGRDALTASELEVAIRAAKGLTNRQIAQELFNSVKTIEMHITRIFRKLDISSRSELPRFFPPDT